jgi:hypothetical protein
MKSEINPSDNYRKLIITVLGKFSYFHNNQKPFCEISKDDILSYLDSFRKPEAMDPLHKWIGTYNLYRMLLMRFFRWFYYQDIEPSKRPKPKVVENIAQLKRKEHSIYKPTDLWSKEDDILFLKYCPNKRDKNGKSWTFNEAADFWRYTIGVNVIPADTINKNIYEKWGEWQDKPIPEEIHNQWKLENKFSDGIAVILGKVWHNKQKSGLYLNGIDADNLKAIEEICTYDSKFISIEELAKWTIVEQHIDDTSKAHVYVYSHKPFAKKSSDKISYNIDLINKIEKSNIPAIEVKGQGQHGVLFCSPSVHKNGYNYQILGTKEPVIADDFEQHIDNICRIHGISYLENGNGKSSSSQIAIEDLFKPDTKIYEGHNRHEALLRVMESLISRNKAILHLEKIKGLARE